MQSISHLPFKHYTIWPLHTSLPLQTNQPIHISEQSNIVFALTFTFAIYRLTIQIYVYQICQSHRTLHGCSCLAPLVEQGINRLVTNNGWTHSSSQCPANRTLYIWYTSICMYVFIGEGSEEETLLGEPVSCLPCWIVLGGKRLMVESIHADRPS